MEKAKKGNKKGLVKFVIGFMAFIVILGLISVIGIMGTYIPLNEQESLIIIIFILIFIILVGSYILGDTLVNSQNGKS